MSTFIPFNMNIHVNRCKRPCGQLSILDLPENQISVQEMETFARDEENEIPEGQSDHTIDADKYATYEYYYNFL